MVKMEADIADIARRKTGLISSTSVNLGKINSSDQSSAVLVDIERNHGNISAHHQPNEDITDRVTVNELALQSLSRQVSGRVRIECQIEEGNRTVEMAFLTKAFAIFVAFQVQLYFHEQVLLHSSRFNKDDVWDEVSVRSIWFAIVVLLMPLALYSTRKRFSPGIFQRSFRQNFRVLAKHAVPMLFVWAFKDLVAAFTTTIEKPKSCHLLKAFDLWEGTGVTEATCPDQSVGMTFQCVAELFAFALCAAVLHFLFIIISQRCRNFEKEPKATKMYLDYLANTAPFALGVGYGWNQVLVTLEEDLILENLLRALDSTNKTQAVLASLWLSLAKAAGVSIIAFKMTSKSEKDQARKEALNKGHSLNTPKTFFECAFFVLRHSFIFTAAWGWSEAARETWFLVTFQCQTLNHTINRYGCGESQMWVQVAFCLIITVSSIVINQKLRFMSNLVSGIHPFYVCALLPLDINHVKSQKATSELFAIMISIVVGWAWNDVVAVVCETNILESCQRTSTDAGWAIWAAVVFCMMELMTFYVYHQYMEIQHLCQRVEKVGLISRRQTERLLIGDQSQFTNHHHHEEPDGTISRDEILAYAQNMGFRGTGLIVCYDECAQHTGKKRMPIPEFARAFDDYTDKLATEADADGDGKLSIHEMEAMENKINAAYQTYEEDITQLDADGDGFQSRRCGDIASNAESKIVLDDVTEAQREADAASLRGEAQLGAPKDDPQQRVGVDVTQSLTTEEVSSRSPRFSSPLASPTLFVDGFSSPLEQDPMTVHMDGNSDQRLVVHEGEDQELQNALNVEVML